MHRHTIFFFPALDHVHLSKIGSAFGRVGSIGVKAVSADQHIRQCIFTGILAGFGLCTFFLDLARTCPPCHFLLHSVEDFSRHNRGMIVLHIILRTVIVYFGSVGYAVDHIRLLQSCVALVFFVRQYRADSGNRPCGLSCRREISFAFQQILDGLKAVAFKVPVEDKPDDFRFFGDNLRLIVSPSAIAEEVLIAERDLTLFCAHRLSHADVSAE